jgi:hypothetical protein
LAISNRLRKRVGNAVGRLFQIVRRIVRQQYKLQSKMQRSGFDGMRLLGGCCVYKTLAGILDDIYQSLHDARLHGNREL